LIFRQKYCIAVAVTGVVDAVVVAAVARESVLEF